MFASCMLAGPNFDPSLTPFQGLTGCGAFHRNSPTGGAANGIPLYDVTPLAVTPDTRPPVTATSPVSLRADDATSKAAAVKTTTLESVFMRAPLVNERSLSRRELS